MMNVIIIAVGGLKEKYLKEAFLEYSKRLKRFCSFELIEINESKLSDEPKEKEILKALEDEGKKITKELSGYTAAMCIEGKELSSAELAEKISDLAARGISKINFVIGSSFGLSKEIKAQADLKLSMSKMTFPHQLARVMLAEQIYRAFQINSNGKYHK